MNNNFNNQEINPPEITNNNAFAKWGFITLLIAAFLLTRWFGFYPQEGDLFYDLLFNSYIFDFFHLISPISPLLLLASLALSIIGFRKAKVSNVGKTLSLVTLISATILIGIYIFFIVLSGIIM